MQPRFLLPVCAGILVPALVAQIPGLGEEKAAFDAQARTTAALGGGPWQKFCGVARDSAGSFWAVCGNPAAPTVPTPGKLLKFDSLGSFAASWDQPTGTKDSSFGIRDLAIDLTTSVLYGGWESSMSGGVIWACDLTATPLKWSNDTTATGKAYVAPPGFAVHRGLALNPVTKTMWTCNFTANPLTEFDRAGNVLATIPVARLGASAAPYGLAITPDGKRLWVASQGGSTHTKIDTANGYVATGFFVLIEVDIDPASARYLQPTGGMAFGSPTGGALGGVPPNPVYNSPIAGGLEMSARSNRLEFSVLNQAASDTVSVLGVEVAYGSTCGGNIGVTGDAAYAGNTAFAFTLSGSSASAAALVLGLSGSASIPAGPPLGQSGCKILLELSGAGVIVLPILPVTAGSALQPFPVPATLDPLVFCFQWAEVDYSVVPPLRLSDGARLGMGMK